jgi:hypothetical protein
MAIDIIHGIGYRIGTSNRPLGGPTPNPDGFTVLNQTNNQVFIAMGGVWTDGGIGTFQADLLAEWYLS